MSEINTYTTCGAHGILTIGGRKVAELVCSLEFGHGDAIPVWHASVPVEKRNVALSYAPAPLRYIPGTPHEARIQWADEAIEWTPDADLLDPDEELVDPMTADRSCVTCGAADGELHDQAVHDLYV